MEDSTASHNHPANAEEYRQWWSEEHPDIPYGRCVCGCGQETPISLRTHRTRLAFKGEPTRYVPYHHRRKTLCKSDYTVQHCGHDTPCWAWNRLVAPHGYGKVTIPGSRKKYYAHRVVFELHLGPIPAGKDLDHLCRVTSCVNPLHLEVVTREQNVQRGTVAKLTVSDVLEIRRLHATGDYLQRELAEIYEVAVTTIGQIVRRQRWKNV